MKESISIKVGYKQIIFLATLEGFIVGNTNLITIEDNVRNEDHMNWRRSKHICPSLMHYVPCLSYKWLRLFVNP